MQQELTFDHLPLPSVHRPGPDDFRTGSTVLDLRFSLGVLDAFRVRISHAYDKLSSLSNSRTRLLPHQVDATHRVVNAVRPRFLLADEVGLGKTVEAGLILKELIFRRGYSRIFVAVPAPLVIQWQQEMHSKFNEDFAILNRRSFHDGTWQRGSRVITSIDFIKSEKYGQEILRRRWDMAIFDEAHRLRRDYSKVTHAYAFAEKMAERTEALLLLSATPFRGKLEELFFLLRLIDPHVLGPYASFLQEHVVNPDRDGAELRRKIGKVLIRRRKVEVGGFTKRFATTIRFELTTEERSFYDATTEYVRREYNLAVRDKDTAVGFVMIVFQKLLDSSTRALLCSLERRKHMLESLLHGPLSGCLRPHEEDWVQLGDSDQPECSPLTGAERKRKTAAEIRREVLTLRHLLQLGRGVPIDRKLQKLRESLLKMKREGRTKFIIFTQFKTTLEYLAEALAEFRTVVFHGSLTLKEKEKAIGDFKDNGEILISTEAGGEGRNLQFASILVNYDLPWSPLKIEQRIGRIHRFGQKEDVCILNFSTRDTVADRVLEVLETKIKLFEESIGPSDALLGAIEDDSDFQNRIMQFVSGMRSKEEFEDDLESRIRISREGYGILGELVAPQRFDFNLTDYYAFTQESREIDNKAIEQLTLSYLRLNPDANFALEETPGGDPSPPASAGRKREARLTADYNLRDLNTGRASSASFRSEVALENEAIDFLAVGHPLVDRALSFFLLSPSIHTTATIRASHELDEGVYAVFIARYAAGRGRAELLSCHVSPHGSLRIPQEILIPPASDPDQLHAVLSDNSSESAMGPLARAVDSAYAAIRSEANARAVTAAGNLQSAYDGEAYKIEVSYGKRIRSLEEKRDIQRLRCRSNAGAEHRALLGKVEHELERARAEKESGVTRVRLMNSVEVTVELLQIYRVVPKSEGRLKGPSA